MVSFSQTHKFLVSAFLLASLFCFNACNSPEDKGWHEGCAYYRGYPGEGSEPGASQSKQTPSPNSLPKSVSPADEDEDSDSNSRKPGSSQKIPKQQ